MPTTFYKLEIVSVSYDEYYMYIFLQLLHERVHDVDAILFVGFHLLHELLFGLLLEVEMLLFAVLGRLVDLVHLFGDGRELDHLE